MNSEQGSNRGEQGPLSPGGIGTGGFFQLSFLPLPLCAPALKRLFGLWVLIGLHEWMDCHFERILSGTQSVRRRPDFGSDDRPAFDLDQFQH
jgi:hypothetical protein